MSESTPFVIPDGFVAVSKHAFHAWMMGTKRNVHPTPEGPWRTPGGYVSHWEDLSTHRLLGMSDDVQWCLERGEAMKQVEVKAVSLWDGRSCHIFGFYAAMIVSNEAIQLSHPRCSIRTVVITPAERTALDMPAEPK